METKNQELFLSLTPEEMMEVNGGDIFDPLKKWLKKAGLLGLAITISENWAPFEEGVVSGWNSVVKPKN